jgi:elongation factor 1-beta
MGTVLIKIKLMPSSPDTNLDEIKANAKKVIEEGEGKKVTFSEESVAFGLMAIIASFDLNEDNPLDSIESNLGTIENVNSAQVIDMRRAFG